MFSGGIAKLLQQIDEDELDNIRLFTDDALKLLPSSRPPSLDGAYLLYPDPWPKTRHHKRRFISPMTLGELARVLKPGAAFRFATDIEDYADWTLAHVLRSPDFRFAPEQPGGWQTPFRAGSRRGTRRRPGSRAGCELLHELDARLSDQPYRQVNGTFRQQPIEIPRRPLENHKGRPTSGHGEFAPAFPRPAPFGDCLCPGRTRRLIDAAIEELLAHPQQQVDGCRRAASGRDTMRFTELQRDIGTISQKALTATLRALERDGFVTRTSYATIPPRVDYELTEIGGEVLTLLEGLKLVCRSKPARVIEARRQSDEQQTVVLLRASGQKPPFPPALGRGRVHKGPGLSATIQRGRATGL